VRRIGPRIDESARAPQERGAEKEVVTMAIIRWMPQNPVRDLVSMQEEMNRIFDNVFGRSVARSGGFDFTPVVDIEENPEQFVVKADLPGCSSKDVKVNLMGDTLTIRGERKQESERKDNNMLRCERVYGSFERSFTLGTPVRADQVKATFKDGVLEVQIPKAEEARLREIEVKIGS
jgi:HSP20 family protein